MIQMHAALDGKIPFPLLLHGSTSRKELLDRFRSTPNAVLFGTSSFWQGVDVQGDQLSCVIVDRLPFSVPNDPIVIAAPRRSKRLGEMVFFDYQIPHAVIALKQGFGRLVRSRSDHGILAILDPRIRHPRYGHVFLASLPDYTITSDLKVASEFLRPCESGEVMTTKIHNAGGKTGISSGAFYSGWLHAHSKPAVEPDLVKSVQES